MIKFKNIYFVITVAIVLWASAYVGIRAALASYSPGTMALFRYLIASIVMMILYFRLPTRTKPSAGDLMVLFVVGALGFSVYNVTLNMGEQTVTASIASFMIAQVPVLMMIFAQFTLGEKLTTKGWLGLLISFSGIVLIAVGERDGGEFNHGVWIIMIAVFSAAIYNTLQKPLLKKYSAVEVTSFAIWFGTLALMGYLPHMVIDISHATWSNTLWVIYMGIFPGAIAYLSWTYVLSKLSACQAGSYLFILPVATLLLGALMLGEMPGIIALVGGFIALCGAMLIKIKR